MTKQKKQTFKSLGNNQVLVKPGSDFKGHEIKEKGYKGKIIKSKSFKRVGQSGKKVKYKYPATLELDTKKPFWVDDINHVSKAEQLILTFQKAEKEMYKMRTKVNPATYRALARKSYNALNAPRNYKLNE